MSEPRALTDEERAVYEWQMWDEDFGVAGQERLKGASVLISRVGGLGSVVAYELAAAGGDWSIAESTASALPAAAAELDLAT